MMTKRWISTALFVVCLVIGQASASAGSPTPMQTVKERIDQIISVLNDPQYHTPARKEAQRDKIWEISKNMFDFTEISRRTVGPKWDSFSDPEKSRFTDVFMQFLGNTYIDKMQGEYHNEQVVYLQEIVKEPQALVRTQLKRENIALPIDYRMKHVEDKWKIYDILVENGVSIVQNYRVQFQSILQKESPAQLIARLEEKLKEQQSQLGQ
ncbi:MAG: ABC transporter substrate-binding protein [Desulfobacterales bacterium]|nr:ABC transporter substrate-binding protein [Desulfobacterales bacterium]